MQNLRPVLSRSLQALGLLVTPLALVYGLSTRSMTAELSLLLLGVLSFVIGRAIQPPDEGG